MENLFPVKPFNNDRKQSYFHLQTKDDKTREVSFSPEKHKLLEKLQNHGTGCELKTFRLSNRNETIINDYTSVRRSPTQLPKN